MKENRLIFLKKSILDLEKKIEKLTLWEKGPVLGKKDITILVVSFNSSIHLKRLIDNFFENLSTGEHKIFNN